MMIASSTTMPMARIRANRVIKFTVKPSPAIAMKAPMIVTGESREVAEALLAQFDAGDVTEAHELGGGAAGRLDRDRVELAGVGEPAEGVDCELEGLVLRDRRAAELPGHHLDVLPPDGVQHVLGREPEGLQALRVQPDPHAVGAGSDYPDLAD